MLCNPHLGRILAYPGPKALLNNCGVIESWFIPLSPTDSPLLSTFYRKTYRLR